jgi:glycosyltransferase involved in cell wall biosynthesis
MITLVLTRHRPYPPASGAPLRNWQNIRALMELGPVDVVSVGEDAAAGPVEGIRDWAPLSLGKRSRWDRVKTACWVLRPGVFPAVDLNHATSIERWLRRRILERRYDLAVLEGIAVTSYVDVLKRAGCRLVFDAHNVESAFQRSLLSALSGRHPSIVRRAKDWILSRRMLAAERRAVMNADVVWACSDHDATELEHIHGRQTGTTVVPNGVDVESYRRPDALPAGGDWSRLPITLLYPGLFSYLPNEDAAARLIRDVLPAVRARGRSARLVLVGRNPTPSLVAAARQDSDVVVTGEVDSIVPYLEQACVVALPIAIGSGTRLKILEAFAVGRPVVSSAKGAEGIDGLDGEHLLIRETPGSMAEAIIDLWDRPALRSTLCQNALELVRSRYSWSIAARRIAQSLNPGLATAPYEPMAWQPTPPDQRL